MRSQTTTLLIAVAMLALLLPAAQAAKKEAAAKAVDPTSLVWPLPPDKPRVRYLEELSNNLQIEPVRKRSFFDKLAGVPTKNVLESFDKPSGVATDSQGRVYVASLTRAVVYVIDKEHKNLERITGGRGLSFRSPVGVATDDSDNLYVSDSQLNMVLKFDRAHNLVSTFGGSDMKGAGYIAVDDARRRVFVVDTKGQQVLVYNLETLQLLTKIDRFGKKDRDHFSYPVGVGVNRADGTFAVTDTGSCSVKVFSADFKLVRSFGEQSMTPGNFVRPKGVQFDSEGNIWVADAGFNNFQIFNNKGQVLMFVGVPGTAPGEFQLPNGLYIDRNNRVYVSDQMNARVQVFQFLGGK